MADRRRPHAAALSRRAGRVPGARGPRPCGARRAGPGLGRRRDSDLCRGLRAAVMLQAQVDHLVVAARSLEDGVEWCRETLGFVPDAGGEHPLMGTHNRVFRIAGATFPRAYFEIIAINPK